MAFCIAFCCRVVALHTHLTGSFFARHNQTMDPKLLFWHRLLGGYVSVDMLRFRCSEVFFHRISILIHFLSFLSFFDFVIRVFRASKKRFRSLQHAHYTQIILYCKLRSSHICSTTTPIFVFIDLTWCSRMREAILHAWRYHWLDKLTSTFHASVFLWIMT